MSEETQRNPDSSVTVVISRRVKPGCEAEFEAFLTGVIAACSQFPGYLGSNIFRPVSGDDPEYRVIFKFDQLSHLRRWEASEERQHWFAQAEPLTEAPPQIQVLTGLETWFTLPGKPAITPPPRHKMALVTWLAVFPLITVISTLLQDWLVSLPLVLRVMVVTAIAVPTMTYGLMPQVTRLFANWLYPPPQAEPELENDALPVLEASATEPLPMLQPVPTELEVEVMN
ncbi:antibiotic biosynthesis monooxygenase [Oscillatoria sp. FACHB-1407]|uniref:antibiotic biosynthesis monooxygenase n=1 Tax=Oscillatoria sp. FACHB-1407 TaxID=2692847 RepID=UPI001683B709|nr:antibiotic biosynthesis monooxygenase [Oscillatoria sp. FACHB-1407]MBD2463849.1 antibiotic biosynthesis monooxygenase [Oscillatoria sp. FACHB-1407]